MTSMKVTPWKESYDNLAFGQPRQCIIKQRLCQQRSVESKLWFFQSHVWMWELDHKEDWRIDAFELWCWRRFLRVPWTARKSDQSILKEINPEYLLERLMLKLKLQHLGCLMWRANSLEKTLLLGKTEDRRRRGWQDEMVGWHHRTMDVSLSMFWVLVMDREAWYTAVHRVAVRHNWATEHNWCRE